MSPSSNLWRAVERARKDPFFMGWVLAAYENLHALEKRQVAEYLQCPPDAIDRLALCRRPFDIEPKFQAHLRRIADFVACNADRLVQIVREVDAVNALRESTGKRERSMLLAARDRKGNGQEGES